MYVVCFSVFIFFSILAFQSLTGPRFAMGTLGDKPGIFELLWTDPYAYITMVVIVITLFAAAFIFNRLSNKKS